LIAKWVTRGEGQEGGGLHLPDTATSFPDEEEADSDGEVAKFFATQKGSAGEDGPGEEASEKALEEKRAVNRFILQQRAEHEHDGDMFGEDDAEQEKLNKRTCVGNINNGASAHDYDQDLYYKAEIGEVMDSRYRVVENMCGQGVFSNVVKAKDLKDGNNPVAIKVIRCNDMMRKAADKEVEILKRLNSADPKNTKHVIRLLATFMYRDHMCLAFECMWDNLRAAMKKYTKGTGMSLKAVRAYSKQLLVALRHIHRCEFVHLDMKPDNILISAGHNTVKICDLGSAMEFSEVEPTTYIVSRFYRAPEIVMGAKFGAPCDTFALGATLFEIFTGKILFPGRSNNDMVRLFMEVKGKLPKALIKSGSDWKAHFNDELDFKFVDKHKLTKKKLVRIITDCSAKNTILDQIMNQRIGAEKQKSVNPEDQLYVKKAKQLADLVGQMTALDPEKRANLDDLQKHPFVAEAASLNG
jgi:serine/threonine-protein kinase PRP4